VRKQWLSSIIQVFLGSFALIALARKDAEQVAALGFGHGIVAVARADWPCRRGSAADC
jgi:hypothetical protein